MGGAAGVARADAVDVAGWVEGVGGAGWVEGVDGAEGWGVGDGRGPQTTLAVGW